MNASAGLRMRVLYDISTLGLAHHYRQSRGGAYRADLHVTEGLASSDDCELLFCANHSAVAFHGCEAFLRTSETLRGIPLLASHATGRRRTWRAVARIAHRSVRSLFGNVLPAPIRRIARVIDRRLHPPVSGSTSPIDIFHSSMAPLPDLLPGRQPRRFLTVYDLSYIRFPEIYGSAYRQSLWRILKSLRPGDHVITSSAYSRDEIAEAGHAPADRIHVVPLAADPVIFYPCRDAERIAAVRRKYGIPEGRYVLCVNTPDVRKNVPRTIDAFARAMADQPGAFGSMVLTGHPGPGSERLQDALAAHPTLRDRFIITGYVPDADLAPLYSGAHVFVYCSIYEGFGLPPLEAMQCGTPVITSDTSSLPEVVGNGGVMVSPHDVDGLAAAMLDVAGNLAERQARALAQASTFSWARSTASTLGAYRTALQQ